MCSLRFLCDSTKTSQQADGVGWRWNHLAGLTENLYTPGELVTDDGPQVTAAEFESFLETN